MMFHIMTNFHVYWTETVVTERHNDFSKILKFVPVTYFLIRHDEISNITDISSKVPNSQFFKFVQVDVKT